jgi:hypothetical protein
MIRDKFSDNNKWSEFLIRTMMLLGKKNVWSELFSKLTELFRELNSKSISNHL